MSANGLDYDCDFGLALNFNPLSTGTIGYLLFWSGCGGLSLQKDVELWNPFVGPGQTVVRGPTIACVGVIESFRFDGDPVAPIRIVAYLSKAGAANVRNKLTGTVTTTSVQVSWYIISYDEEYKEWFEAALIKGGGRASANVNVCKGSLQLFVDAEASCPDERLDVQVYRMEFQIVPSEGANTLLEFATGPTQRLVRRWAQP